MIEVELPDGRVLEIDAPDAQSAAAAAQKFLSAQQQAPQQPQPQGGALQTMKDATQGVAQGITGNWSDELFSYGMAPFGMIKGAITGEDAGKSLGQRFTDNQQSALKFNRDTQKQAQANSPIANTIGQVAGGVMTASNLAKGGATLLNVANPTIGNMAVRGAAEGALYGAAYGAGDGEGLDDKISKGAWGMGTGAITGGLTGAVTAKLAQNSALKSIPSADALEQQAKAAYKTAENAGVVFKPMNNGLDKMIADANKMGLDKTLTPNSTAAIARLEELRGVPATLETLELKRRIINNAVKTAARAGNDADVAILNSLRGNLDTFVGGATASDLVVGGDPRAAISALNDARKLWAMQSKSNLITDAVESASLRAASTGSGGNVDNATRQNLRRILENPRGFSKPEIDALETAVRGTKAQNALRLVGKLSPSGNGLMAALHGGSAVYSNGATIPLAAAGFVAKKVADDATKSNVRVLDALIRSGGNIPQAKALSPAQRAIIDSLLANQNLLTNRQQLPVM